MIQFILGRACTGKTHTVIDRACCSSNNKRSFIIVPEQFSFESERAVVRHPMSNPDNISVLSFTRLFNRVVEASNVGFIPTVSDFEKIILIKKAIRSCSDELQAFSRFVSYHDFPQNISDTIGDFKFAGATPEKLKSVSAEIDGSCGGKLHDIALIWSTYDALLENKFIDPADYLTRLYQILCDINFFKGADVYFDSFTGFTGQQYKVIEKIIEQADNVVFSLCSDGSSVKTYSVFYNVNNTVATLKRKAAQLGINDITTEVLDKHHYSNDALLQLEEIMAGKTVNADAKFAQNISIISCENPREEALAAANIISKCVSEENYRFKDFILVSRSADTYAGFVDRQCKNHNIAYFSDKSVSLVNTLLCMFIRALFDAAQSMTTQNIMRLLKMDLYDFSIYEVAELEDYTYVWDIKSADWHKSWEMSVKGLTTDEEKEHETKKRERINETREKIVGLISSFKSNFCGSPKKRALAIYNHLKNNGIDKKLSSICLHLEEKTRLFDASVMKQSWDSVINVLDCIVRTLDDCDVSADEFIDSFLTACEFAKISNVPQMLDEVTFGSADRIRPSKPKIAIVMGANQGVFPQTSAKNGLLGFGEKEKIKACGINLDDDIIKSAVEENYLVYSMLCCPIDKVYVTYSRKAIGGEALEPSAFLSKIQSGFPGLSVTHFALTADGDFSPRTARSAFSEIGILAQSDFGTVRESLSEMSEFYDRLQHDRSEATYDFSVKDSTVKALFGNSINISPTNFEKFHRCKASYFFKCGLQLKKLKKADLNQLQRGTLAHFALESVVQKHKKNLANLTHDQLSAEVDEAVTDYFKLINGSDILVSERFNFLVDKISSAVKEIIYHMSEEFAQCDFDPKYCELSIGDDDVVPKIEYILHDGSMAFVEGKVDRVDVFNNKIRIVDYKTGSLKFSLSETLVGLNMQMLIYLHAIIKNGSVVSNPEPAGVLYKNAHYSNDPKSLKMSGLIVDDDKTLEAMEKGNKGRFIPKKIKNSTTFVDKEVFSLLFDKIDELMVNMGDAVLAGNFTPNPIDVDKSDGCKYCEFASICRNHGKQHRVLEKHSTDEIISKLKGGE